MTRVLGRTNAMINDYRQAFKLMRLSPKFKMQIILASIFFILGVVLDFTSRRNSNGWHIYLYTCNINDGAILWSERIWSYQVFAYQEKDSDLLSIFTNCPIFSHSIYTTGILSRSSFTKHRSNVCSGRICNAGKIHLCSGITDPDLTCIFSSLL